MLLVPLEVSIHEYQDMTASKRASNIVAINHHHALAMREITCTNMVFTRLVITLYGEL